MEDTITKYSVGATKERKEKFGGVDIIIVDGQPLSIVGATDYLDAFREAKIFNEDQYNAAFQLIRDYQIGSLYKWKIVKDMLRTVGLSGEDAEKEREEARLNFNYAVRYNPEFMKIANFAHLTLEQIGVYIPSAEKLQQLADRLINFYCAHERIIVDLETST